MNRLVVSGARGTVRFEAGAGFDSEYELNYREATLRERVTHVWRTLTGRDDDRRFTQAFSKIWGSEAPILLEAARDVLREPLTAHKVLAAHYFNRIRPYLIPAAPLRYLEIGAGSGYLAALVHHHLGASIIVIDLPEILPFSLFLLRRLFPSVEVHLPNETFAVGAESAPRFFFLTPDDTDRIPDGSIDLAVNTASFGEMLPEQIRSYFRLLRRTQTPEGLFFTANRAEKLMEAGQTGSAVQLDRRPIAVRFKDYPWCGDDRDVFYALSDFHALVQPQYPVYSRLCRLAQRASGQAVARSRQ
jgi:SAM-dependent methyltransferase